jgi:hypothetical protein
MCSPLFGLDYNQISREGKQKNIHPIFISLKTAKTNFKRN